MSAAFDLRRRVNALEKAAQRWMKRDSEEVATAIDRTLTAPNAFTAASLSAAIDRAMAKVTSQGLTEWVGSERPPRAAKVAVLNAGNVPLVGLQDFLAVLTGGHEYIGITSRSSPYLLPAFAESVHRHDPSIVYRFSTLEDALVRADAAIATGSSATVQLISRRFENAGVPVDRQLLRGTRTGVAVLDGSESSTELFSLASDVLLHEGRGCRSVTVVFAPDELDPEAFVEQANEFRRDFPAHERTLTATGRARRLLDAVNARFFQGHGFILIEEDVALREPCVIRWIRYHDRAQPLEWLNRHREMVQVVVGGGGLQLQLPDGVDRCDLGQGQDPPLTWCPDGRDTMAFLRSLSSAGL